MANINEKQIAHAHMDKKGKGLYFWGQEINGVKKRGLIVGDYHGSRPMKGEIWRLKVIEDSQPQSNKGFFIVRPLERIKKREDWGHTDYKVPTNKKYKLSDNKMRKLIREISFKASTGQMDKEDLVAAIKDVWGVEMPLDKMMSIVNTFKNNSITLKLGNNKKKGKKKATTTKPIVKTAVPVGAKFVDGKWV